MNVVDRTNIEVDCAAILTVEVCNGIGRFEAWTNKSAVALRFTIDKEDAYDHFMSSQQVGHHCNLSKSYRLH